MGLGIPHLKFQIPLESDPLNSRIVVRRLAVLAVCMGIGRVSTDVTFGRGDLSVCPLGGFIGALEHLISTWRGIPQGSPQGQPLRALLLSSTCAPH